ncbi:hypothetical protein EDD85DRAFT_762245, partial [Armillaria nabsnona]
GTTQRTDVSWCFRSRHATRVIPEGTIKGTHFMQKPDFVQVTGIGDFIKLNIHNDNADGELDPNGPDLARNPLKYFIYSSAFRTDMRDHVFDSTVRSSTYCFIACDPAGKMATEYC